MQLWILFSNGSQVHNNLGNGVVTRYPRLDLRHSNITRSGKAGFLYDPFFSEYAALSVRSMIHETRREFITETPTLNLQNGGMTFLLCPSGIGDEEYHEYNTEVSTEYSTYRIVLQVSALCRLNQLQNKATVLFLLHCSIPPPNAPGS